MEPTRSTPDAVIDLALGFDDRYAPHAAATIRSVVRASPGARFRITILFSAISEERRRMVEQAAPAAEFRWIEVGDGDMPAYADREHFSQAILYRLGLDLHAPADCRRIIYIDTDVICTRDLSDLWATDLRGSTIGAVEDSFVPARDFAEKWNLNTTGARYFNSGVLVIDIEKARAEGSFRKALEFVARHAHEIRFADQDALNLVYWGHWTPLELIWNVQRHMAVSSLSANLPEGQRLGGRKPGLVHFTGPEKPWISAGYHPWAWLYWRQIRATPFGVEVSRAAGVGAMAKARMWARWMMRRPV